jgi:hypothetical protein
MSGRRDRDSLLDIQEAIRRILSSTAGYTYEQFIAGSKTQDAVVRNLEVIGEATKKLSRSLRGLPSSNPLGRDGCRHGQLIHDTLASIARSCGRSSKRNCRSSFSRLIASLLPDKAVNLWAQKAIF